VPLRLAVVFAMRKCNLRPQSQCRPREIRGHEAREFAIVRGIPSYAVAFGSGGLLRYWASFAFDNIEPYLSILPASGSLLAAAHICPPGAHQSRSMHRQNIDADVAVIESVCREADVCMSHTFGGSNPGELTTTGSSCVAKARAYQKRQGKRNFDTIAARANGGSPHFRCRAGLLQEVVSYLFSRVDTQAKTPRWPVTAPSHRLSRPAQS